MSLYTLHIRASPEGGDLIRCHNRIESLTFVYDKHGNAELEVELRINQADAYALYDRPALPYVIVCYAGARIWAGRLTVPTIGTRMTKLTARGYWDAFSDNPYTALWSTTSVSEFRPVVTQELANAAPSRYEMDTNNRVFITAKKGETFGNAPVYAGFQAYELPDRGERDVVAISFDYEALAPVNWRFDCNTYTNAALPWTIVANVWGLNATGVLQTGSQSLTVAACDVVTFRMYYNAAAAVSGAETGNIYLRITNVRISTQATPVYGSDIAAAVVAYAETINDQVSAVIAVASSLDLRDEIYEDALPADIISRVASIDDVRAYVDEQRVFWYGQTAPGRWQLDIADLEIERPLDRVRNRAYGVYQDTSGRTLRTADADNTVSQVRYGVVRMTPVSASSSNATQVGTQRDVALADTANPAPRASLTIRRVLDSLGRPTLPHLPRPGDLAIIPSLPPTLTTEVDQIRSFVIGRVAVSLARGRAPQVTIEPNEPTPTLTTLLARTEALIQRVAWSPSDDVPGSIMLDGPWSDYSGRIGE